MASHNSADVIQLCRTLRNPRAIDHEVCKSSKVVVFVQSSNIGNSGYCWLANDEKDCAQFLGGRKDTLVRQHMSVPCRC